MRAALVLPLLIAGCGDCRPPQSGADVVLERHLLAPSSTRYIERRSILSEIGSGGIWHLDWIELDSQNEHGVMVRHRLCVVYLQIGSHVQWSKDNGVYPCDAPPKGELLEHVKSINEWRK